MTLRLRRGLIVLLVAGAAALFAAAPAQAHALLKRSVPANGSTVTQAPREILLFFTEPPEPSLSSIGILDSSGDPVTGVGTPEPEPGNPEGLRASVRAGSLADGVYTVTWRTVSKTDGHLTAGSIAFGVGVPATATSGGGARTPTTPSPSALAVTARWLFYWGLALLLGGAVAGGLLFGWSLPRGGRALAAGAWGAAAAGVILMTAAERATIGLPLGTLLSSRTGPQTSVPVVPGESMRGVPPALATDQTALWHVSGVLIPSTKSMSSPSTMGCVMGAVDARNVAVSPPASARR